MLRARVVAIESPIHPAHRTLHGLGVGVKEDTLREHEGSGRIRTESTYCVMGVVMVEASDYDLLSVANVIAIGIAKQHKMGRLGNIDSFCRQLESMGRLSLSTKTVSLSALPSLLVSS